MEMNLPEEIAARYRFLCQSTQIESANSSQDARIKKYLDQLATLVSVDFRALARQGSPNDFADIYFELQQELDRFNEFCSFPALAQKFVVAFGGSFSAGKSSLINALLGKRLLVTEVDPTTSLPTYLLHGDSDGICAHNLFGVLLSLRDEEFQSLTHDELRIYGSNISRLLRSAFITRAEFPWRNLAIIDTPGYSNSAEQKSDRTDAHLARTQLNAAQAIVWVIDARQGCITEEDLNFLASLDPEIPRVIALTRADQKLDADVHAIAIGIEQVLAQRNIAFAAVIPVSARNKPQWSLGPLREHLESWNTQARSVRFTYNFKRLFQRFADFIDEEQCQSHRHIHRLNRILALVDEQQALADAKELGQHVQRSLASAQQQSEGLYAITQAFFQSLHAVGEAVGIALPEPSAVDLLEDNRESLLSLIIQLRSSQQAQTSLDEPEQLYELCERGLASKIEAFLQDDSAKLQPHFASELDEHLRESYAGLVAAVLLSENSITSEQCQLFDRLLDSLLLSGRRELIFLRVGNISAVDLAEYRQIFNSQLLKNFLLDTLVLCGSTGYLSVTQRRLSGEIAACYGLARHELALLASLAGYILGRHNKSDYTDPDLLSLPAWGNQIFEKLSSKKQFKKGLSAGYYYLTKSLEFSSEDKIPVLEKSVIYSVDLESLTGTCRLASIRECAFFNIIIDLRNVGEIVSCHFFGGQLTFKGVSNTFYDGEIKLTINNLAKLPKITLQELILHDIPFVYGCVFTSCSLDIKGASIISSSSFSNDNRFPQLASRKSGRYSLLAYMTRFRTTVSDKNINVEDSRVTVFHGCHVASHVTSNINNKNDRNEFQNCTLWW